jgi:hypothetical protein
MVVPLQTLPGWPTVPTPSVLGMLALFVGFPVVVWLIVTALVKLRARRRVATTPATTASADPLWLRGEDPAAAPTVEGVRATEARRAIESTAEGTERGGASARW